MLNAECNGGRQPAGWRLRNGQRWFPTMEGVAILDPANRQPNSQAPPVVIEEAQIDQQSVSVRDSVRRTSGQTKLELRYTANSLLYSEAVTFQYQLTGFDRTWVEAGTRRSAHFELSCDARTVRLTVTDNGQGFVLTPNQPPHSFGLNDIAERVRLLGGTQQIDSTPGQGTTVQITLPRQPETQRSAPDVQLDQR